MGMSDKNKTEILQEKALEMVKQNPSLSMYEISKRLGKNDKYVANWKYKNINGFRDRYEATLKEAFSSLEGVAIDCMKDLIVEDRSFQAAKYVLDNRGYKAEDKIKADVNNTVDINITIGD